ncbi:MAG: MBL fold metallo-hydrolase [Terriglobales bacterium]
MELYPGVHQIRSLFGGRNLFQYVFVGEQVILLDSGVAETPEKTIFPYLESVGVAPQRLALAVTMHADLDHQGGNSALRDAARHVQLACHAADRVLIEHPEALYALRYDHLHASCGTPAPRDAIPQAGGPVLMDVLLQGGERLRLAPDWELEVWHVPGHSDGHLAIYDAKHRAVFTSDAVQSAFCPMASGAPAFGPTYYGVDAYLATIHFLEQQPLEHLYSGHWPDCHGAGVLAFLDSSRQFVERTEALLPAQLDRPQGASLGELVNVLAPKLGDWPRHNDWLLMWALYGHLVRLEQRGGARRIPGSRPWRWTLGSKLRVERGG